MKHIMIDTHIVVWFYTSALDKISIKAKQYMECNDLIISPIVLLELQYLFDIGKLTANSEEIYEDLYFKIGLRIDDKTLWYRVVKEALILNWTRDPFDRLIVAHTKVLGCNLITRDRVIESNFNKVIW